MNPDFSECFPPLAKSHGLWGRLLCRRKVMVYGELSSRPCLKRSWFVGSSAAMACRTVFKSGFVGWSQHRNWDSQQISGPIRQMTEMLKGQGPWGAQPLFP